ncbi:MipA/OmpV family protein [Massilia aurea]|uniref:MipA/OmpV family protein n=1 Tax=Massilia aurea TaxID=373040 RepID=UPI0034618808
MKQFFALALAAASSAASGQMPATNPMPDGSRDMYAGLGAVSRARYEGADSSKTSVLPVLQVQWSNGVFISGMSAGMHLSTDPKLEFGPLVSLHANRDESGNGGIVDGVGVSTLLPLAARVQRENPLAGMPDIGTRVEGGAFLNYYLNPAWRFTSNVLIGSGRERDGARMELGVQRLAVAIAPQHTVSFNAGVTLVNRDYNRSYFGVTDNEAWSSGNPVYRPGGGLKDVRVGARWNWALSPSWMLTTNVQATRLTGSVRHSPLVERPTNVTVSTAFAIRF